MIHNSLPRLKRGSWQWRLPCVQKRATERVRSAEVQQGNGRGGGSSFGNIFTFNSYDIYCRLTTHTIAYYHRNDILHHHRHLAAVVKASDSE